MKFLSLGEEIIEWLKLWRVYSRKKIIRAAGFFEKFKNFLARLLIRRRGTYQRPFLHFSMVILLAMGIVAAPIIAQNYPLLKRPQDNTPPSAALKTITALSQVETETLISEKPRDKIIIYKVQKGDTVSSLAQKFGISLDTIRWANDLKSIKDLSIGQEVKILPVTGVAHKVQKGETIYSIAKKYEANPQAIVDFPFNDFVDPSTFSLAIGQILIVPDGVKPAEKPWSPLPPRLPEMIAGGEGALAWPAGGQISQRFVWYHKGIDIANKNAPAIGAAEAGRVTLVARERWGYGYHLIVDHGGGLETLYAHLQRIDVSQGEKVSRGQTLGQMGCTGRCTGTHLHFEVRKGGAAVNPFSYLK